MANVIHIVCILQSYAARILVMDPSVMPFKSRHVHKESKMKTYRAGSPAEIKEVQLPEVGLPGVLHFAPGVRFGNGGTQHSPCKSRHYTGLRRTVDFQLFPRRSSQTIDGVQHPRQHGVTSVRRLDLPRTELLSEMGRFRFRPATNLQQS